MKWKALIILLTLLVSLFPVYVLNKYLQKKIYPEKTLARLILYLFSGFALVFAYTFLITLFIKLFFHGA